METKSRKLRAKIEQGYQDNRDRCGNCTHFEDLNCLLGVFSVVESAVCAKHQRDEEDVLM